MGHLCSHFIEHYGKITDWYWKRAKKGFFVKLLSNQSDVEKKISGKYYHIVLYQSPLAPCQKIYTNMIIQDLLSQLYSC